MAMWKASAVVFMSMEVELKTQPPACRIIRHPSLPSVHALKELLPRVGIGLGRIPLYEEAGAASAG